MTIEEIRERYFALDEQLRVVLSTMYYKHDDVKNIRQQILELQEQCPHEEDALGYCKYCRKKMGD